MYYDKETFDKYFKRAHVNGNIMMYKSQKLKDGKKG